jgi:hypothetical protein
MRSPWQIQSGSTTDALDLCPRYCCSGKQMTMPSAAEFELDPPRSQPEAELLLLKRKSN